MLWMSLVVMLGWFYTVDAAAMLNTDLVHFLRIKKNAAELPKPDIYLLHVDSFVRFRYARTKVTSKVVNPANASQEVVFTVFLPDSAFITSFLMEINGKKYKAFVKEKEQAYLEYQEAVTSGQSAAHVGVSARDSNKFTISVNIEPTAKVQFVLSYEELLTRTLGMYNHVINLNPGQVVRDLKVNVQIDEPVAITKIYIPELRSTNELVPENEEKENKFVEITRIGEREVYIKYTPSAEQQALFLNQQHENKKKSSGGQLVIQYDVDRTTGGQVLVNEGYFVHFFSPQGLPPLRKLAVFVLDVSGSMEGRKLEQLKQAMSHILDDLGPNDYFNIIEFSYSVTIHNLDTATGSIVLAPDTALQLNNGTIFTSEGVKLTLQAYPSTTMYIKKAKQVIQKMSSGGGTNINDALKNAVIVAKTGLNLLLAAEKSNGVNAGTIEPIIIFLTDGDPTVGITNPKKILAMVKELNSNSTNAIFSLGFGDGADLNFLRKLSLANAGFARNIYEASDAALQLNNFYKEIASPLLSNVTFNYPANQVQNITKSRFQSLFLGSELVITGKVTDDTTENVDIIVEAISANGTKKFNSMNIRDIPDDISDIVYLEEDVVPENISMEERKKKKKGTSTMERLWAHLTIKQLLDEYEMADINADEKKNEDLRERALRLALRYNFVTLLTSLVVVKPNETTEIDTDTMKPGDVYLRRGGIMLQSSPIEGVSHFAPSSDLELLPFSVGGSDKKTFVSRIDRVDGIDDGNTQYTFDDIEWLNQHYISNTSLLSLPIGKNNSSKYFDVLLNATEEVFQECDSGNANGHCKHLVQCVLPTFIHNFDDFIPYFCVIDERFAGVCCPGSTIPPVPFEPETTTELFIETTTVL